MHNIEEHKGITLKQQYVPKWGNQEIRHMMDLSTYMSSLNLRQGHSFQFPTNSRVKASPCSEFRTKSPL